MRRARSKNGTLGGGGVPRKLSLLAQIVPYGRSRCKSQKAWSGATELLLAPWPQAHLV